MPTITVYAAEGRGRVKVECPFGGRKIFFASEEHVLQRENRFVPIPAGVAYVHNTDLARRTKGRVRHLFVPQGLYHLLRLAGHTVRSNADEIEEMYARRRQIREEASELLASGMMSDDDHERILREVKFLEERFSPPKRAEEKLMAAKHLGKAHDLRASGDRRKIAPSSMTAYAAGKRVTIRIRDLNGIRLYFSSGTMRISSLIREYCEAVEDLWAFFEPPRNDRRGPRTRGAFFRLMKGLEIPAGRESALRMLRRRLSGYVASMKGMTCMPFRDICRRIAALLRDIDVGVVRGEAAPVRETVQNVRRLLRQLRMIHVIETTLVARLSWYLKRTPANIRSPEDPDQVAFRTQFQRFTDLVIRLTPADFHRYILPKFFGLMCEVGQHLDDLPKTKELLKDLTAALAKDPFDRIQAVELVA